MTRTPQWDAWVAQARAVKIETVIARRGIKLQQVRKSNEFVGACPICAGTDRFSINTKKQVFNCRGCGKGGNVIALVQHIDGADFAHAVEKLTGEPPPKTDDTTTAANVAPGPHSAHARNMNPADYERRQHEKARWLWRRRDPVAGTIAETYLRSRGITGSLPATLGYLPARKRDQHPALIAAFGLADEIEPGVLAAPRRVEAVHLTLLSPDGTGKAAVEKPKLMIGSPGDLPIIIAPPNDLMGLAITEGIEDAATVHQATGLGAWAAGAAGRLPALADVIPDYVEVVSVAIDDDDAGTKFGTELVHRIEARGIEARPIYLKRRAT
jgi:hypothetical protein